jgi:hypothetical protein
MEMRKMPNLVGNHRAARAACVRPAIHARPEHEVIDDELAPLPEEIEQADRSIIAGENIILIDPDHRLASALSRQRVTRTRGGLFLGEQCFMCGLPFGGRYNWWKIDAFTHAHAPLRYFRVPFRTVTAKSATGINTACDCSTIVPEGVAGQRAKFFARLNSAI